MTRAWSAASMEDEIRPPLVADNALAIVPLGLGLDPSLGQFLHTIEKQQHNNQRVVSLGFVSTAARIV